MFERLFNKTFEGEEQIAQEKARINWPYTYRLIIKAKVTKSKPCKKCCHKKPDKKVWGYLIDQKWAGCWEEYIKWEAVGTKTQAKTTGLKKLAKLIGRGNEC